jgi:hypothetical protein
LTSRPPNARLQPQAARNRRERHDVPDESAPIAGCKPMLDCLSSLPRLTWSPADGAASTTNSAGVLALTAA